ncbi:MAG: hypothetical protein ACE5FC_08965 [Myxococcota bacterium]
MEHSGTGTPSPSPAATPRPGRRRHWKRYAVAALAAILLGFGFDTLLNSAGDIREFWLSYGIERYIMNHPHLSASDTADLRAGRVVRGWSREKCRVAWGKPDRVLTIGNLGTEIWQYGGNTRPAMLVFTDGILTDFGP